MKRSLRPSPAMVVACVALFVALGSGTYAAVKLKPGSVKTKTIRNGAVKEPKLANNAVSTQKIADAAVTRAKLGAEAVDAGKIAPGALTKAKFAANGVATNTGNFALTNSCTVATFTATGVQPGDAVAWSFRDVPGANGLLVLQAAENMVQQNVLSLQVCEVNNIQAQIDTGDLQVDFVAIR